MDACGQQVEDGLVQLAGVPSWSVDLSDSQLADLALYVREAAGLRIPAAEDVPPTLDAPVPHRSVLADDDRALAGSQWLAWWRRILESEFTPTFIADRSMREQRIARLERNLDPPHFTSLAQSPQLQAEVVASYDDGFRWHHARGMPDPEPLDWTILKQAAGDVAFDRQVSMDRLDGSVRVLPVAGSWWQRVGPGQVLCSKAAAADRTTAYALAHDLFVSSLER